MYDAQSYNEAERVLQTCLKTAVNVRNKTKVQTVKEIQFYLSFTYLYLEKWDDAWEILFYLTNEEPATEAEVLLRLDCLAALTKVILQNTSLNRP